MHMSPVRMRYRGKRHSLSTIGRTGVGVAPARCRSRPEV